MRTSFGMLFYCFTEKFIAPSSQLTLIYELFLLTPRTTPEARQAESSSFYIALFIVG